MKLLSAQLLNTAKKRLSQVSGRTETDLRRAISDLYYCLFHRVCEELVSTIGVKFNDQAFNEVYRTLYRLPDHYLLEAKCKELKSHSFSPGVCDFAIQLINMKNKRQIADYDPLEKYVISEVENDLVRTEDVLKRFSEADQVERVRFSYFVSIKARTTK